MELQMSIGVSLAKQMSMQKRVFSNLLGGGVEVQAVLVIRGRYVPGKGRDCGICVTNMY